MLGSPETRAQQYGYDPYGNQWLTGSRNLSMLAGSPGGFNLLNQVTDARSSYDLAGNVTGDRSGAYGYDVANRLSVR